MMRRNVIFVIAFLGILSTLWVVKKGKTPPPKAIPKMLPPQKPYAQTIAASGIIEAAGENVAIGSPENGIVKHVYVEVWQRVKKGDPLFQLDERELAAELKVAEAKEEVAKAELTRVQGQLCCLRAVKNHRAISQEELRLKENEEQVSRAALHQAIMEKEKTKVLLSRLTVCSPIDGVVIQKNIKQGEYLLTTHFDHPPLILGDMAQFQVRVDIDEQNASRMVAEADAVAYPKNRPDYLIPLSFVRIDPLVVPKTSLTGSSKEKVDTRVLQAIYTFTPPKNIALYIGQQVDVYIKREQAVAKAESP